MQSRLEMNTTALPSTVAEEVHDHRRFFWIGGVASIVLGVLAILMPYVATVAAELVIGALFAAYGIVGGIAAFRARGAPRMAMGFFLALLTFAVGLLLLVFPSGGVLALTVLLSVFFVIGGAMKLLFAWRMRPVSGWGWVAAAGTLSLLLGVLIWSGLPGTAFWVLGILVGIDLVSYGIALLAIVGAARPQVGG